MEDAEYISCISAVESTIGVGVDITLYFLGEELQYNARDTNVSTIIISQ